MALITEGMRKRLSATLYLREEGAKGGGALLRALSVKLVCCLSTLTTLQGSFYKYLHCARGTRTSKEQFQNLALGNAEL